MVVEFSAPLALDKDQYLFNRWGDLRIRQSDKPEILLLMQCEPEIISPENKSRALVKLNQTMGINEPTDAQAVAEYIAEFEK